MSIAGWLNEELARQRESAPEQHRHEEAADLLDELVLGEDNPTFFTLVAYERDFVDTPGTEETSLAVAV